MSAAASASSYTLSKLPIDDSLQQEPFLKSNYTTVCCAPLCGCPAFLLVGRGFLACHMSVFEMGLHAPVFAQRLRAER